MKKGYRRKRKNNGFCKAIIQIILSLFFMVFGSAAIEYQQTGAFKNTEGFFKDCTDYVQDYLSQLQEKGISIDLSSLMGEKTSQSLDPIPEYQGEAYVVIDHNEPAFTDKQKNSAPYEFYSELDSLGRCGYAEAKISIDLMPTKERGQIGMIKPSGWHTIKYDNIDGRYLYNRCHLIGYQLTGENANNKNLITGTRYMNVTGMLEWENMVADYIKKTKDQVLYRVTPIFEGDDLVAKGVHMEALSLGSDQIKFNIFVFNIQPGIKINYTNGDSQKET